MPAALETQAVLESPYERTPLYQRTGVEVGERDFPDDAWLNVPNVPVFAEHSITTRGGRQLTFGRDELAAVAENCNRRIRETGDYAGVTVGHTPEGNTPDAKPMPLVGLAGPFRVSKLGNRWAILADIHVQRDQADVIRQYPRRSAELWVEDDYADMCLDPIALLGAEAPRLDMGLTYSRGGGRVSRYAKQYSPGSLDERTLALAVKVIDNLNWVQWAKSEMNGEKSAGSIRYDDAVEQYRRLRDETRRLERYRASSPRIRAGLDRVQRALVDEYASLQRTHREKIEQVTRFAARRAARGEHVDFDAEMRKAGIPKIPPPPSAG